jgi:YfiH family protein
MQPLDELVWDRGTEVPLLRPAAPGATTVVFSSRIGGVSEGPYAELNLSDAVGDEPEHVSSNRRRLAEAAGLDPARMALARQVHGADVLAVGPAACGIVGEADALVTRAPGTSVGVLTADCVPVLLKGDGVVGAAHAGWRGLVAGVLERALEAMEGATVAYIGPAIKGCCYEVGEEVIEAFRERDLPVAASDHVDPPAAAAVVLERSGVARVVRSSGCTHCDETFFSYRRDGSTGRQGAFIALR